MAFDSSIVSRAGASNVNVGGSEIDFFANSTSISLTAVVTKDSSSGGDTATTDEATL